MASDVVDELQEKWPEVEDVTVDRVICLKQGMIQSGAFISSIASFGVLSPTPCTGLRIIPPFPPCPSTTKVTTTPP